MRIYHGDLWDLHAQGVPIVVTTNLTIKSNGEAVMGRGIAKQAMLRFPDLPRRLAEVNRNKVPVAYYPDLKLYTFAVKYNWWEDASLPLIQKSYEWLFNHMAKNDTIAAISRPGCGNGHLDWKEDVEPIFAAALYMYQDVDHNLIFVP